MPRHLISPPLGTVLQPPGLHVKALCPCSSLSSRNQSMVCIMFGGFSWGRRSNTCIDYLGCIAALVNVRVYPLWKTVQGHQLELG
jgi:hypothetical protein